MDLRVSVSMGTRSRWIWWAVTPSFVLLAIWYTHVAHTYASFGPPYFMSDVHYGPWLSAHTSFFYWTLLAMWLGQITLVPLGAVVCSLRRRWRPVVPYILVNVACVTLSVAAIVVLTPEGYMEWFLD